MSWKEDFKNSFDYKRLTYQNLRDTINKTLKQKKGACSMVEYREEISVTQQYKQNYLDGLDKLIASRQRDLAKVRNEYIKEIMLKPEKYRDDFKKMLGWPLVDHHEDQIPKVKAERLATENGYTIYRMTFEILDGLEMSGLYFEMDEKEKKPLVLVQHGGLGTPEGISGFYDGNTTNYNHMLERVIAHRVHAFAPQLLLWNKETYSISYDRVNIDARLKRIGSSITAVELYGLTRILDYFESKDNVSSFGMVGLSYGGFYTLFLSAIDTRIRSAISCSFFNSRDHIPWSDWTWFGSAGKFDDAEVASLIYPRKLCIEIGTRDNLFDVTHGVKSYEKVLELCKDVGTDWLSFITFEGTHEFCKDDSPIKALVDEITDP